jgi:hypothetical protein
LVALQTTAYFLISRRLMCFQPRGVAESIRSAGTFPEPQGTAVMRASE